jgi:hypothetical protein
LFIFLPKNLCRFCKLKRPANFANSGFPVGLQGTTNHYEFSEPQLFPIAWAAGAWRCGLLFFGYRHLRSDSLGFIDVWKAPGCFFSKKVPHR